MPMMPILLRWPDNISAIYLDEADTWHCIYLRHYWEYDAIIDAIYRDIIYLLRYTYFEPLRHTFSCYYYFHLLTAYCWWHWHADLLIVWHWYYLEYWQYLYLLLMMTLMMPLFHDTYAFTLSLFSLCWCRLFRILLLRHYIITLFIAIYYCILSFIYINIYWCHLFSLYLSYIGSCYWYAIIFSFSAELIYYCRHYAIIFSLTLLSALWLQHWRLPPRYLGFSLRWLYFLSFYYLRHIFIAIYRRWHVTLIIDDDTFHCIIDIFAITLLLLIHYLHLFIDIDIIVLHTPHAIITPLKMNISRHYYAAMPLHYAIILHYYEYLLLDYYCHYIIIFIYLWHYVYTTFIIDAIIGYYYYIISTLLIFSLPYMLTLFSFSLLPFIYWQIHFITWQMIIFIFIDYYFHASITLLLLITLIAIIYAADDFISAATILWCHYHEFRWLLMPHYLFHWWCIISTT